LKNLNVVRQVGLTILWNVVLQGNCFYECTCVSILTYISNLDKCIINSTIPQKAFVYKNITKKIFYDKYYHKYIILLNLLCIYILSFNPILNSINPHTLVLSLISNLAWWVEPTLFVIIFTYTFNLLNVTFLVNILILYIYLNYLYKWVLIHMYIRKNNYPEVLHSIVLLTLLASPHLNFSNFITREYLNLNPNDYSSLKWRSPYLYINFFENFSLTNSQFKVYDNGQLHHLANPPLVNNTISNQSLSLSNTDSTLVQNVLNQHPLNVFNVSIYDVSSYITDLSFFFIFFTFIYFYLSKIIIIS
jgi:hypothetical protein